MSHRNLARTAVQLAAGSLLLLTAASSASAAPTSAAQPTTSEVKVAAAAAPYVEYRGCFNKLGYIKPNTTVLRVDWTGDRVVDECFAIAPDRRIYHVWRTSDGWDEMPNAGRADDTYGANFTTAGYRRVIVRVNNKGLYSSTLTSGWSVWAPY
jgi:hypothetical protein